MGNMKCPEISGERKEEEKTELAAHVHYPLKRALPAGTLLLAATLPSRAASCQGEAMILGVGVDAGYSGGPQIAKDPIRLGPYLGTFVSCGLTTSIRACIPRF